MKGSSTALDAKIGRNQQRKVVEYSGPFSHLPNSILENIILRLSIKRIFVCKCVCKTWYHLISDPVFAKLHFDKVEIYPLLRSDFAFLSTMLYLVQPEQEDFEHKLEKCDHFNYDDGGHECFCRVKVKLDTKLKLPFRNFQKIYNHWDNCRVWKDRNYRIVNSCNGFLCLSDPSDNDPLIICNPITGEFINLPENNKTTKNPEVCHIDCGFGFSPATNQYKVIRMFLHTIPNDIRFRYRFVSEVHILGTKSWKNIGFYLDSPQKLFPTYLNGCIHWFSERDLISFDIEMERFESVSLPTIRTNYNFSNVAMGVLGGEICITEAYNDIRLWVMNSAEKCWSKFFSISLITGVQKWPRGSYQPIKYLNNGAMLMFHSRSNAFLYIDTNKHAYKYLKVRGLEMNLEAIPHISSFVSLNDALSGHDVEVLNVKSRCTEWRLLDEPKISLVAEWVQIIQRGLPN